MQNRFKILLRAAILASISLCAPFAMAQVEQLDSTFGQGAKVISGFSNQVPGGQVNGIPFASLQQSDGKIVVVGQVGVLPNLATKAVALVRYLPNGSLDSTFGNGGMARAAWDNYINSGYSLALMADGRIVVAGEEQSNTGAFDRFGIMRFNPNGTLDTTFGGTGMVTTEFFASPQPGVREGAHAVIVQSDGKIVAAGLAQQGGKLQPAFTALARYNLDGSLDTTFGSGGKVMTTAIPGPAQTLALLSNGDILAASASNSAEFSASGVLQSSITSGSIATSSFATSPASNDTGEIFASLDRLVNAVNTNDLNSVMNYYVPDNLPGETLIVFDGIPPRQYVGAAALRQDWANFLGTYRPGSLHVEVSGWTGESEGNLAYAHYFFSVAGITKGGSPLDFTLRITDVLKKINGNWLAIHEHASWPVDLATHIADLSSAP